MVGHRRLLLGRHCRTGRAGLPPASVEWRRRAERLSATARRGRTPAADRDVLGILVGSTALSTRFDPEDLRELIGAYHRAVADTVGRSAGFVASTWATVVIHSGYPQAHEDDAEAGGRAGLAVIEVVDRLPARQDLPVRLGIATGLAVVGDLIG